MTTRYRATGADLPFTDPRRAHGVGMEGYYWRFAEPGGAWAVAVMAGVCAAPDGTWAMVTLAAEPGDVVRSAVVEVATPHPARLGVDAGPALRADAHGLDVDLGPGARLHARLTDRRDWPRRRWGPLGPAQAVPGIGQYWAPHLLGAAAQGWAELAPAPAPDPAPAPTGTPPGATQVPAGPPHDAAAAATVTRRDLAEAAVYAEKNWGAHFAARWWWGQAPLGDDTGVAFAGGRLDLRRLALDALAGARRTATPDREQEHAEDARRTAAPDRAAVTVAPTALAVWTPGGLETFAPPFARTTVAADGRAWRVEATRPGASATLEGSVDGEGLALPVPVVAERRTVLRSTQHLLGHVELTVRRGRRTWLAAESTAAALELGIDSPAR